MRKTFYIAILLTVGFISACTSASAPGNSGPNANASANVPPEFQGKPVTPDGSSTPGIPDPSAANLSNLPKGTPTPGIPDPATIGKTPVPKGTPTPGIPDEATLKKQATTVIKDANAVNRPPR